jgi:hypothetical protein
MKRRLINGDTGAAFGLIAGIILGSLALNLSGWADPPRSGSGQDAAAIQSAAAVTSAAGIRSVVASQR